MRCGQEYKMDAIEWKKITPKMKVIDTGTHWEASGKLVTFGSKDQKMAQMWLKRRTLADARGTQKSVPMQSQSWFIAAVKNGKRDCKNCSKRSYCYLADKPRSGVCGEKVTKK
jgi:hypothetical protein